MEVVITSKISVSFCETARSNNPEDGCSHTCHDEKVKSHSDRLVSAVQGDNRPSYLF
jgi:hypothetical protein